jgi:Domain of unknown function (DUF4129)
VSDAADRAREEARAILAEDRFHETELPRPFAGVLDWLGGRLRALADLLDPLVPGGDSVLWLLLAAAAALLALAVATQLVRRRAPGSRAGGGRTRARRPDPAALEREAEDAERAGDLERALRLRFRAGVLRLAERQVLDDPSSATSGSLVRRLGSKPFERAAASFDEVVYGRRAPTVEDVRLAREGWSAVLS